MAPVGFSHRSLVPFMCCLSRVVVCVVQCSMICVMLWGPVPQSGQVSSVMSPRLKRFWYASRAGWWPTRSLARWTRSTLSSVASEVCMSGGMECIRLFGPSCSIAIFVNWVCMFFFSDVVGFVGGGTI